MKVRYKKSKIPFEILFVIIFFSAIAGIYFGTRFFLNTDVPIVTVASGSMSPALEVGDLVVVQGVTPTSIQIGDIIVYDKEQDNQTYREIHRVIKIQTLSNGTNLFFTKGDNNPSPEGDPVADYKVHGRVIYKLPLLGYIFLEPIVPFSLTMIIVIIVLLWPEKAERGHFKKRKKRRNWKKLLARRRRSA